jgi:hypothetical protein
MVPLCAPQSCQSLALFWVLMILFAFDDEMNVIFLVICLKEDKEDLNNHIF